MSNRPNRRDFLKMAGLLPASLLAPRAIEMLNANLLRQDKPGNNVLIIVFDAFSAYHIATYGYQRQTTPNIARLAEQAVVYHNHYAGSNFTTPGTASLLTGTLPWTNRALKLTGGVIESFASRSIFSAFKNHHRIAYSHNPWANKLLEQFAHDIDELVPWLSLFLRSYDGLIHTVFRNDYDIASVSWSRNVNMEAQGSAYSLFLSHIYEALREKNIASIQQVFPRGIPSIGTGSDVSFILEQAVNWVGDRLASIPQPFLGYFHFLPPHEPYRASREFYNKFSNDNFKPVEKPEDVFTQKKPVYELLKKRAAYDEFILYADKQFNILFEQLKASGVLENTWVVLTSDHGEMFERGILAHGTDALYQPVIRVPLMIFEPGRKTRMDIHSPTSAIDVMPTFLHVTGQAIPPWAEGRILPPYSPADPDPNRSVYVVRANKNDQNRPIWPGSLALTKGRYKLHYYFGYKERNITEMIKLYDVETDPEELVELSQSSKGIASELLSELKTKLAEADKPYV